MQNHIAGHFYNWLFHKLNSKTRKSSCVKTQEAYCPRYILSMECSAGGGWGRGIPILVPLPNLSPTLARTRTQRPPSTPSHPTPSLPPPDQDQDRCTPSLKPGSGQVYRIPLPQPFPWKGPGTRDQRPLGQIPLWTDTHLWKHNLPACYVRGR